MVSDAKCPSEIMRLPVSSSFTMAPELACTSASKAWCFCSLPCQWTVKWATRAPWHTSFCPQLPIIHPLLHPTPSLYGRLTQPPNRPSTGSITQMLCLHLYLPSENLAIEDNFADSKILQNIIIFLCIRKLAFMDIQSLLEIQNHTESLLSM